MTSLNHYALGSIAHWLHTVVAGIQPTWPGYRTVRIAPQPGGDLTFAQAAHDTPHGRLAVDWQLTGDTIELDVVVPPGTIATVELPLHPADGTHEVGGGTHRWNYRVRERPAYALDTPIGVLASDPATWAGIRTILTERLPQVSFDALVRDDPTLPLTEALDDYSGISAADRRRLTG